MGTYRKLIAWQKAMDLVDSVYPLSRAFPEDETFGLRHQMRSAAVSIPLNLAEGSGRYTTGDQRRFFRQARGSLYELQTIIEIAERQQFVSTSTARELASQAAEVGRLINGLLNALRTKD